MPSTRQFAAACSLSDHIDTRTAATEVANQLHDQLEAAGLDRADLILLFGSFHHAAAFRPASELVRSTVESRHLLACTAESVLGEDHEWEGRAGLAALALHLPETDVRLFTIGAEGTQLRADDPAGTRDRIGVDDDTRAIVMLADPFSTPMPPVLNLFEHCRGNGFPTIPIAGGLASGSSRPGQNVLVCDDAAQNAGLVGASIGGAALEVDFLVSQGCRPIGEPLVITRGERNIIHELGGEPAMQAIHDLAQSLDEAERQLLGKGLFIGFVINEYKDRFGRGDFLIRNVLGFDKEKQAVAVAEGVRVGQTVQLHVRDAETASEDLQLLLDLQELKGRPFAAAAFTCNGRGARLFDEKHHDISALRDRLGDVPIAGFFAGGEIGPVGDRSFVHGHTLSAMLFRDAAASG